MKSIMGLLCLAGAVSVSGVAQVSTNQNISVTMTGPSASWNCTFEATSFSFELARSGSLASTGVSLGSPFTAKVNIQKMMDSCSPVLAKAIFMSEKYTTVKIKVTQSGSTPATLFRVFTLSNVVWNSKSADYPTLVNTAGTTDSVNGETLTLNYEIIMIGDPQNNMQYGMKYPSTFPVEVPPAPCTAFCS
jgi:type VI protein secretion system component Hcp